MAEWRQTKDLDLCPCRCASLFVRKRRPRRSSCGYWGATSRTPKGESGSSTPNLRSDFDQCPTLGCRIPLAWMPQVVGGGYHLRMDSQYTYLYQGEDEVLAEWPNAWLLERRKDIRAMLQETVSRARLQSQS